MTGDERLRAFAGRLADLFRVFSAELETEAKRRGEPSPPACADCTGGWPRVWRAAPEGTSEWWHKRPAPTSGPAWLWNRCSRVGPPPPATVVPVAKTGICPYCDVAWPRAWVEGQWFHIARSAHGGWVEDYQARKICYRAAFPGVGVTDAPTQL